MLISPPDTFPRLSSHSKFCKLFTQMSQTLQADSEQGPRKQGRGRGAKQSIVHALLQVSVSYMPYCRSVHCTCPTAGQCIVHALLQVSASYMPYCRVVHHTFPTAGQCITHALLQVSASHMPCCRSVHRICYTTVSASCVPYCRLVNHSCPTAG